MENGIWKSLSHSAQTNIAFRCPYPWYKSDLEASPRSNPLERWYDRFGSGKLHQTAAGASQMLSESEGARD